MTAPRLSLLFGLFLLAASPSAAGPKKQKAPPPPDFSETLSRLKGYSDKIASGQPLGDEDQAGLAAALQELAGKAAAAFKRDEASAAQKEEYAKLQGLILNARGLAPTIDVPQLMGSTKSVLLGFMSVIDGQTKFLTKKAQEEQEREEGPENPPQEETKPKAGSEETSPADRFEQSPEGQKDEQVAAQYAPAGKSDPAASALLNEKRDSGQARSAVKKIKGWETPDAEEQASGGAGQASGGGLLLAAALNNPAIVERAAKDLDLAVADGGVTEKDGTPASEARKAALLKTLEDLPPIALKDKNFNWDRYQELARLIKQESGQHPKELQGVGLDGVSIKWVRSCLSALDACNEIVKEYHKTGQPLSQAQIDKILAAVKAGGAEPKDELRSLREPLQALSAKLDAGQKMTAADAEALKHVFDGFGRVDPRALDPARRAELARLYGQMLQVYQNFLPRGTTDRSDESLFRATEIWRSIRVPGPPDLGLQEAKSKEGLGAEALKYLERFWEAVKSPGMFENSDWSRSERLGRDTAALLKSLGNDPAAEKLLARYQELGNDPAKRLDRLKQWQIDVNSVLSRLDHPLLDRERRLSESLGSLSRRAEEAKLKLLTDYFLEEHPEAAKLREASPGLLAYRMDEYVKANEKALEARLAAEPRMRDLQERFAGKRAETDKLYQENPALARYGSELLRYRSFLAEAMRGGGVKDGTLLDPEAFGVPTERLKPGTGLVKITQYGIGYRMEQADGLSVDVVSQPDGSSRQSFYQGDRLVKGLLVSPEGEVLERRKGFFNDKEILIDGEIVTPQGRTVVSPAHVANRPGETGVSYVFTPADSSVPTRRVTVMVSDENPDRPTRYIVSDLGPDGVKVMRKVEYSFAVDPQGRLRTGSQEWIWNGKINDSSHKSYDLAFKADPLDEKSGYLKPEDLQDLNVSDGRVVLQFPGGRERVEPEKGLPFDRIGDKTIDVFGAVSEPTKDGTKVTDSNGTVTLFEPKRGGALVKISGQGRPSFYTVDEKLWAAIRNAGGPERSDLVDMLVREAGEEVGWSEEERASVALFLARGLEDSQGSESSLSISKSAGIALSFGDTRLVGKFGPGTASGGREVLAVMANDLRLTKEEIKLLGLYKEEALHMPVNIPRYEFAPEGVYEYSYRLNVDYGMDEHDVRRIGLQIFVARPAQTPRLAAEYDLQKMMTDWQRFTKALNDATPLGAPKLGRPLMDLGRLAVNALDAEDKESESRFLELTAAAYGLDNEEQKAMAKIMKESDRAAMLEIVAFYGIGDANDSFANKQGAIKEILAAIKDPQARSAVEDRILRNGVEEMKSGAGWVKGDGNPEFQRRLARRMLSPSDENLMTLGFDRFSVDERHKEMLDEAENASGWRSAALYAAGFAHKGMVMTAEALPAIVVTAPLGSVGAAIQGPSKLMLAWGVADQVANIVDSRGQNRVYAAADLAGNLSSLAALHYGTKAFHEVFYAEETQAARTYEQLQKEAQKQLDARSERFAKERLAERSPPAEQRPPADPADIGGLKVPKGRLEEAALDPDSADPLSDKLHRMSRTYSQPGNAGVKPTFMKVEGEYVDIHTGLKFSEAEMGQLKAWGNAPEMMSERPGYRFDGVDPFNKNRILVTNLEKGLQYSIEVTGSKISGTMNAVGHSQAPGGGSMVERLDGVEFKGELNFLYKNDAYRAAQSEVGARARELLREAAANPDGSRNPVTGQGEAARLRAVLEVLSRQMPYSDAMVDKSHGNSGQTPGKTNVAELIGRGGVCRHQNMVAAAMVEDMIKTGKLDGEVRYVTANGHAWSIFKSAESGKTYVLDVAQGNSGIIAGKRYWGVEAQWNPKAGTWDWVSKQFDYAGDSLTPAERRAAGPAPVAARAKTSAMAENDAARGRAVREQFELTAEEFGKDRRGPDAFAAKLPKAGALPENGRGEAAAKFVQGYLGTGESLTASKPQTDPLSGAQVYLLRNPQGAVVAAYKVFINNGKGPRTIMNELGAGRELGSLGLTKARPVEALGAWRLGDSGEIGYLMEGAPGKDFYGYFKEVGAITDSAARANRLEQVRGHVETLARAMAEVHGKSRSADPVPEAMKAETVRRALDLVDKLSLGTANENRLAPDVARALKERITKLGADYVKENLPASVTHGDAHPGNFFFDEKTGGITMIDLETAMESVEGGKGVNSPMADVGRFSEMIALANGQKGLGLSPKEIQTLREAFDRAYGDAAGLPPSAAKAHELFYQAKMQTTVLKFAKGKAEFDQAVEAIRRELGLPSP